MALTANRELQFYAVQELIDLPVDDNVNIYKGAFVGRNRTTGLARPLVAGDEFLGVAYRQADNTIAGHAAGGINIRLHQAIDIVHTLSGVANADIGKDVYASDDSSLTLTPTGNSRVGRVVAADATNLARVRCKPVSSLDGVLDNLPVVSLPDATQTLSLDQINRVLLMGNSAARTVTLPAAATCRAGSWLRLVKTSAAAFAITIDPSSVESIDGASNLATVDAQYDCVHALCTGTEWIVLSRDIS
jgi:hypothetical protein